MYDVEKSSKKADKRHKRLEQRYESSVVKSGDPSLTKFFSTATSDILAVSKRVVYDIADGLEEVGGVLGLIDQSKNDELHFAEFVHMLQSGHLDDLFPDRDWKESCKEIHDLRRGQLGLIAQMTEQEASFSSQLTSLHSQLGLLQSQLGSLQVSCASGNG